MPNPVDVKIGQQIRILRKRRDISGEILADRIGVTVKQMQRYERGTSRISIRQLVEIADALGAPVSAFFDGIDKPGPENDNLTQLQIATKQGLALLKAFHSINDVQLRYKMLKTVEAMANAKPPYAEEPSR